MTVFAAALGAFPPEDQYRTWVSVRILWRTSERLKEVVDKMIPSVVPGGSGQDESVCHPLDHKILW
jgi:hypothetical protein